MTTYVYTCQVQIIAERQVEIESEHELTCGEIALQVEQKVKQVLGDTDINHYLIQPGTTELALVKNP